jgi:hypothetical protein
MAAATVTKKEFGYTVSGDTGAVAISGKLRIKALAFAGNTDNATCAVTSRSGSAAASTCFKFKTNGNDLDAAGNYMFLGDNGVPFDDISITLSHASDVLYIYLV